MEEMRVQIEAREPTDGEIRAFWFTLPIDTEQVEELLGIDVDTDYYYITGKELPFADEVQEDTTIEKLDDLYHTYESLPSDLKEDYIWRHGREDAERYAADNAEQEAAWIAGEIVTDVARHILNNDPDFTSLSENVTRYFDYEAYGQYLDDNGRFVETDHGIYELP